MDTAAQFFIQVFKSFVIFGIRLYIHFFPDQLSHIFKDRISFVGTLNQHLTGQLFASAVKIVLFQVITHLDRVGNNVGFTGFQHLDQTGCVFSDLDVQLQPFGAGEVFDQIVFVTHRFHFILEVGSGAVKCHGCDLALRFQLGQVGIDKIVFLLLFLIAGTAAQKQSYTQKGDDFPIHYYI